MLPAARSLFLLLILGAAPVLAQEEQVSVKLNVPTLASQYLSVPDKTGLEGMTAMTIEAWVYPTSTTGVQTIVGNDYRFSYWLGIVPTGNPSYPFKVRYYPTGGVGNYVECTPADLQLNRWTHIAVEYDVPSNAWICFVNAVTACSGLDLPSPGPIGSSAGDLRIGADREGPVASYFFRGYLDEVRIWSAAKSASVLRDVWLAGAADAGFLCSDYLSLQAWWTMWGPTSFFGPLVFSDDREYGSSDLGNHAVAMNGASPSTMAPPVDYNVGVQFTGSTDYAVTGYPHDFSNGLTLEAWIAPSTLAGFPTIVGRDYTSSFWLGLTPAGHLRFYPTGGVGNFVESVGTIATNRWTHVAVTYRNGRTRFYIDGVQDAETSTISGPVGENGRPIYVGADDESGGPAFFYTGLLDEVRITDGERSPYQIRSERFIGHDRAPTSTRTVVDALGEDRFQEFISFGRRLSRVFTGGSARLVRSGAPLASPYGAAGAEAVERSQVMDYMLHGFRTRIWGGMAAGMLPPGTNSLGGAGEAIEVAETTPITDVDVFMSLPTTSLAGTGVYLNHPDGTLVTLLDPAASSGRGLHTVFDDESGISLALGIPPYVDGVQPSTPLSALDGKPSNGTWKVLVTSAVPGNPAIGLWAFGLSLNGVPLAVGDGTHAPPAAALRNVGANPGGRSGTLEYDLPMAGRAVLRLYDVGGRCVSTLGDGRREAGSYRVFWSVPGLPPGNYFVRLAIDGRESGRLKVAVTR
jgi:subtilisin-like proprotein convertase family protein